MIQLGTNVHKLIALAGFILLGLTVSDSRAQTSKKKKDLITYFQPGESQDNAQMTTVNIPVFRLQPGTEISVTVSSLNNEADVVFNPALTTRGAGGTEELRQLAGYTLDSKGAIAFPLIGKVQLMNLTTQEASEAIQEQLKPHLSNPFVTVRVVNFQVTVMGEVAKPMVLNIHKDRLTLPEAISLAGDLTIYGKRENVLVVREVDGKREFARIDLHDRSLFGSPYYYLKPNDMIYVEPIRGKKLTAGRLFPWLPTIISSLSLISVMAINLINR